MDVQTLGDMCAVPFFAMTACYFYSMRKRNLMENTILAFAVCAMLFDSYFVIAKLTRSLQTSNSSKIKEDFVDSPTFKGKKEGFVFTTRDSKTGYYKDE